MSRYSHVIVGLGATGLSTARYLKSQGIAFAIMDTRLNPPCLKEFKKEFPGISLSLGGFDETLLDHTEELIVSPGISLHEPAIAKQVTRGIPVIGDIELFAQATKVPVIAVTGTNAKSTVTTLVGEMAKTAKKKVQIGGNIGTPVLDLLNSPTPDVFVMELSSFQLETTYSLAPKVATILNITPDHMDRYGNLEGYRKAKQRIYSGCEVAVCNRDDVLTTCHNPNVQQQIYFTLNEPREHEFGLLIKNKETYLAFQDTLLMPVKDLPIVGRHYQANALAALAIGYSFGLPFSSMIETLREFKGLSHRCQWVRELNGVSWYNDSKGTNVGASLAAILGFGPEVKGKIVLIAGGISKNADFSMLMPAIEKFVKTVILIGEAAPTLARLIGQRVTIQFGKSMEEAVSLADKAANPGDCVLLSPACASFDMFKNFEHRGDVFSECVRRLR